MKSIEETPTEDGTIVTFHYGEIAAGTTVGFNIAVYFNQGRADGDTFTNTIDLCQDGVVVESATSDTVTLSLERDFSLSKSTLTYVAPKADEEVLFQLIFQNNGDGGATISDVLIVDALPTGLVPDLNYTVTGYDDSPNFPDTSLDGAVGYWDSSTLYFPLSSYSGEKYVIQIHSLADSRVTPGETLTNTAYWNWNSVLQDTVTSNITIYIDKVEGHLAKIGPSYCTIGGVIQYELFLGNLGTVPMTDFVVTELAPKDLILEKLRCTSFTSSMESYSIYVTTQEDPDTEILVAENLSEDSEIFYLPDYIPENTQIYKILWKSDAVFVNGNTCWMSLWGRISDTASVDTTLTNTATMYANSSLGTYEETYTVDTLLSDQSVLEVTKGFTTEDTIFYSLSEFTVYLEASAEVSQTISPIFVDVLPSQLLYVENKEYYTYYDGFTRTTYDSRDDDFPVTLPLITVLEDYPEKGQTLVRYDFTGFTLQYRSKLTVYFDVLVALGATDTFTNTGYLGNPSDNAIVIGTEYQDTYDLDGDTYTSELIAQSNSVEGIILYNNEFYTEKWVKGALDLDYAKSGTTTAGGTAEYQLYVTNNQDAQLTALDIVDIFPYIGDTGVLLTDESRGSQFPVYPVEPPTAKIVNILSGDEIPDTDISIEYSTSHDPIRYSLTDGIIGTGEWLTEIPEDLTTIAAIRVLTGDDVILEPYERLIVTVIVKAPVGTPVGNIAYNSFAVKGTVTGSDSDLTLYPTEPAKVALEVVSSTLGAISGFTWIDTNNDGIYDDDETKTNGVTVELYNTKETLLATTVTADSYDKTAGYYAFTDLEAGDYLVKFIPETGDTLTLQNTTETNGSKPDPSTGYTNTITLALEETITDINAGITETDPRTQAVTDLIQSIALEETALSHILNAEGEKIQKAVALDLTAEELLAVNTSVDNMVKSIMALEEVLSAKLKIATDFTELES